MKLTLLLAIGAIVHNASAEMPKGYDERLADAIKLAENSKRYPYGIIAKRPLTDVEARRWCINTIKHRYRDWESAGSKGAFITYLGGIYCPVGAANDPTGLNRNWVANCTKLMR